MDQSVKPKLWLPTEKQVQLTHSSYLQRVPAKIGISDAIWQNSIITIRYRQGGEKIVLPHRQGHHSLKKLFQAAHIPPWERAIIPLIYSEDTLIAIADLWISAKVFTSTNKYCYQLKWLR
jgi:tRNA(Ile)-lysidine synthase